MASTVENDTSLTQQAISSFNSQITPYIGRNISGSQVNALIQLVVSIDNNAIRNSDSIRRVSIYKNSESDANKIVMLNSDDTSIKYGSQKKVETGRYYTVEGISAKSGIITTIIVKQN